MGNYRIGLQPAIGPHRRSTADKENVAPQQQPNGRAARSRQGTLAELGASPRSVGKAPLRTAQVSVAARQPAPAATAAKPHSVRTPGHGMQGSPISIQHHRNRVLSQIEHLPTEGGKRAWRKPIETMELLDRHVAQLPPAQTIKLLQQMQVILSIKDTRTRDANLQQFAAGLQPSVQRPRQQPLMHKQQPVAQRQQPPMQKQQPLAQRQQPLMQRQQPLTQRQQPLAQRQQPLMQRQQPLAQRQQPLVQGQQPLAQKQPPQPAKLSFKDFEGLAALRPRQSAPAQAAHTHAPQYARPAAAKPQPVRMQAEPELTLQDFEHDAEKEAAYHGHAHADYGQARADYASYLARRNPSPPRAASAPPRMQRVEVPVLSHHEREQIRRAEDDRARYHGEMPNYQQAYADHLAQRPTAQPNATRRASQAVRVQPRALTAQELHMIHQAEDDRARYHNEMPDYASAEASYRSQLGR